MSNTSKQQERAAQARKHAEGSAAAEAWKNHEHVSGSVQDQAQRLIDSAGSPELARQAVEVADQEQAPSRQKGDAPAASRKDQFAKHFGFRSYLELFEASTSMSQTDGKNWFVTALPSGKWICWNEQDLQSDRMFGSFEEACACVPPAGTSAPA